MILGDKNFENLWPSACQLIKGVTKRRLINRVRTDRAKHLAIYMLIFF